MAVVAGETLVGWGSGRRRLGGVGGGCVAAESLARCLVIRGGRGRGRGRRHRRAALWLGEGGVEEAVAGIGGSRRPWLVGARGRVRWWRGASGGRSRGEEGVGEEEDDAR